LASVTLAITGLQLPLKRKKRKKRENNIGALKTKIFLHDIQ
jgi:hypothetical protein